MWIILKMWYLYEMQKLSVCWDARTRQNHTMVELKSFIFLLTWGQISVNHMDFLSATVYFLKNFPHKMNGFRNGSWSQICKLYFCQYGALMFGYLTPIFRLSELGRDREGSLRGRQSEQIQEMVALLVVLLSAQLYHRLWQAFWLRDYSFLFLAFQPPCFWFQFVKSVSTRTQSAPGCTLTVRWMSVAVLIILLCLVLTRSNINLKNDAALNKCFRPLGVDGQHSVFDSDEAWHLI